MSEQAKKYRVIGYSQTRYNEEMWAFEWKSKAATIFQCDTLDEALNQVKFISENHHDCTRFEIVRGEWY
ncbi:hypothetical protein [Acinetobacter junii]|uniref:hypothetical protein n=1 Tax=Acinetobacter junii TaxID=40215 RepID=UPI0012506467|nr:hypothetical protein [Acinetobacter junii]MDI6619892.1 hypothetical protein [Acinetobacter junii]